MEELKELLLKTIDSKKKCYFDIRKLAGELKLNKTSDFVLLNKALNELEDDYLIFRDKNNYFYSVKQSNFYRGIIRINKKGFGFLDLDEDNSIYIPSDAIKGAFDNDEVLVERIGDEGVVRKIIAHNTEYCVGIISGKKNSFHFDDERLKGKSVNIVNRDSFNLVSGLKVQIKILDYKHPIKAEIVKIIGHISDHGVDISSILVSNGIKMEFDDSTLEHANMIKEEIDEKEYRIRRDLRDRVIVTIDGDDSKDFDDAISIEKIDDGYKLGVHIADVSYYVTYGSALDNEAYQRGTSVYVCDRVVPMLPHVLSNGICSLNPHVERLCISCDMMVDHDGNVTDYELFPSII
ncbi:MAG: RNB domain-containing ribonuclease, partial [Firmicutes bacterium]|nr:RNB domain-containing ribonuclease [Bacillota bacterium]